MNRRHAVEALALLAAGCAASPPPAPRVHLPFDAPEAAPPRAADGETWQLVEPLRLPAYADRDTVLGLRWAEPLREAIPRLLRADLAAWRGAPVWGSPLPAGVTVTQRLRVELLALEDAGGSLRGVAQWVLDDPGNPAALRAPKPGRADLRVPGLDVGAWRRLVWRLAGAIVQA